MLRWITSLCRRTSLPQLCPAHALGERGERQAAKFLRKAGLKVLAGNYRCDAGEIDIIALDHETLVFVEVKTRSSDASVLPEASVDTDKKKHIRAVARHYLAAHPQARRFQTRYDTISIVWPAGESPTIRHLVGAFT